MDDDTAVEENHCYNCGGTGTVPIEQRTYIYDDDGVTVKDIEYTTVYSPCPVCSS